MRTIAILVILLAAACGGSSLDSSGSGNGNGSTVIQWTLAAQSAPVQTTVTAGTPVSWHNGDGILHNVIPDASPPPTAISLPGGATSTSQTFNNPGTFAYHCSIHPAMRGTLTIQ